MTLNELNAKLAAKGWKQEPDGSWSAPGRNRVGGMEANRTKPASLPALERRKPKRPGGPARVAVRITLVALRHRLLDRDAIAASMKPLTDAIAATLGIDDDDPRADWEWQQAKTNGAEGVMVKIERLMK
jgi:hypothetical protein